MPAGVFPVPKDVRTNRSFTIVKGVDRMIRTPVVLTDPALNVDLGEFLAIDAAGLAVKATAGAIITAPLQGARASWTLYRQGDTTNGQADAVGTGQVDLLSAPYQAQTQVFDTGATYLPGAPLVVIHNGGSPGLGFLAPLDPATADAEQLAAVVGTVVVVPTNGILHYEAK